ncbi:hypothetical protein OTERR_22700 [Oryzomicrobium terrae]|uniref:DUF1329 domain-containing protein n=1 Tax=Oryzomicrobium terrae TaxID=1735038 RepID=A0A5C1EA19_9RHOO|nr:hypothetical protein [Oryzomicrobium terrae]QEL65746.1 hypothetical protein OTERR_22700 [Oryzomicrobium terrae]
MRLPKALALGAALVAAFPAHAAENGASAGVPAKALDRTPIEATTATGDPVRLLPNGRWEYVDADKAKAAKALADQFPENHTRPVAAQGGVFGVGRTVMPGDRDYNRGSLGHK